MKFKECINCEHLGCTLNRVCMIERLAARKPNNPTEKQLQQGATIRDGLQDDPEPPCNQQFSHNGLCPCCGVEVERSNVPFSGGAQHDECMSCGWESDLFYDW